MPEWLSNLMSMWSSSPTSTSTQQLEDAWMNNTAYLNNTSTNTSKPGVATTANDLSFLDSFAGYTDAKEVQHAGWGTTGIKSLSGLMSMWNGYQANQLAQKQYELSKQAFEKNYAASVKAYNNSLTNQANRMAARGESAMNGMTADEYTAKYGLSK